jgi:hypothetical protein
MFILAISSKWNIDGFDFDKCKKSFTELRTVEGKTPIAKQRIAPIAKIVKKLISILEKPKPF